MIHQANSQNEVLVSTPVINCNRLADRPERIGRGKIFLARGF